MINVLGITICPPADSILSNRINIEDGQPGNELQLGLHPTAITKSGDNKFLYITNGNSDYVSVVDVKKERVIDSIPTGLFGKQTHYFGSSPGGLLINDAAKTLYVANRMDNAIAIAVVTLGAKIFSGAKGRTKIAGYIPTEALRTMIVKCTGLISIINMLIMSQLIFTILVLSQG